MKNNFNAEISLSVSASRRDLIYALEGLTTLNPFFDSAEWTEGEADDLRKISRFLDRSLADLKKHMAEKRISSGELHSAQTKA